MCFFPPFSAPNLSFSAAEYKLTSPVERPFYQPEASLALFQRTLDNLDLATGETRLTGTYETNGTETATHTESFVPLPSTSAPASGTSAAAPAATTSGTP